MLSLVIGIGIGTIIGFLFGIHKVLLMIWSVLKDIERNTKKEDKGI